VPALDANATTLIHEVKRALSRAAPRLAENGLKVEAVTLELEAVLAVEAGVTITLLKILTLGATHTQTETQTITIRLEPPPPVAPVKVLVPTIADELEEAILVIASAAKEAAAAPPELTLVSADVALEVAVTDKGHVEVFIEGEGEKGNTHTLTITLASTG
jgi:hypothetical protein